MQNCELRIANNKNKVPSTKKITCGVQLVHLVWDPAWFSGVWDPVGRASTVVLLLATVCYDNGYLFIYFCGPGRAYLFRVMNDVLTVQLIRPASVVFFWLCCVFLVPVVFLSLHFVLVPVFGHGRRGILPRAPVGGDGDDVE